VLFDGDTELTLLAWDAVEAPATVVADLEDAAASSVGWIAERARELLADAPSSDLSSPGTRRSPSARLSAADAGSARARNRNTRRGESLEIVE